MRRLLALCFALPGCGRLHFDTVGGSGNGDGGPDTGVDGATTRANVVFVTSGTTNGTFGGLAQADAICASAAIAGGLPGEFRAWLSTSTVDAYKRFAGSRGWVRVDGVPVLDEIWDMINGKMFAPIDVDEAGNYVAPINTYAWSGTNAVGVADAARCGDWVAESTGMAGQLADPSPTFFSGTTFPCSTALHLYCFEVGFAYPVVVTATAERIAFISQPTGTNTGLARFDAQCASDATAAGLPGTYLAAIATRSASIASRFTIDGRQWTRVDGMVVATGAGLFDDANKPQLAGFINQMADGGYRSGVFVTGQTVTMTVGTNQTTCNDWTTGNGTAPAGTTALSYATFWGGATVQCPVAIAASALCLQQ